jgi:argininosuccinate lyase
MSHGSSFPHPAYERFVLGPAFRESQRLLFPHMIAASEAHTLMLHETGILPQQQAVALLRALPEVSNGGPDAFTYAPAVEDLFFAVESRLIELAGPEAGGNLQIARSRNDLDAVMCRMMLRGRLLAIQDAVTGLRRVLLDAAAGHVRSLMPGITHTQPAQPTTLAHYLLGVLGPLERDSARLLAAWDRVNRCPLGVAAFTTTSFPIDRNLTARLLGFDGIVENGYDAVGANDHMLESVQALVTMAGSLSRFVHDLLIWARHEVGVLKIDDAFIQVSSIMPQKRNPVVLEHIRARIGYVYGDAATVQTIVHSSAFGDTVDVEDPVYVPLDRAFDAADAVVILLTAALESATFDTGLLATRAGEGHTTTTALAEGLVRQYGLPFRPAHTVLSRAVNRSLAEGVAITADVLNEVSAELLGEPVGVTAGFVEAALDPWSFVEARAIPGGPALAAVELAIAEARERLAADETAVAERRRRVMQATADRGDRIQVLAGG